MQNELPHHHKQGNSAWRDHLVGLGQWITIIVAAEKGPGLVQAHWAGLISSTQDPQDQSLDKETLTELHCRVPEGRNLNTGS